MTMPSWISLFLDDALEGVSRKELRDQAQEISAAYRSDGTSAIIRSGLDALAYATVRMPATYAAIRAGLEIRAADIVPDFGAAIASRYRHGSRHRQLGRAGSLAVAKQATLIDRNAHLCSTSRDGLAGSFVARGDIRSIRGAGLCFVMSRKPISSSPAMR